MSFPERLRLLMESKGMRSVDLAKATGLSEAAISDYLNSKKEPRGRQSIGISKALGVSLDDLWETGFDVISSKENPAAKDGSGPRIEPANDLDKEFYDKYSQLTPDQKKMIKHQIEGILASYSDEK